MISRSPWLLVSCFRCLSKTTNFPPHSECTGGFLPFSLALSPAPPYPCGNKASHPRRSSGRFSNSGWLQSFLRILIALSGWEFVPRRRAFISGEAMKCRYRASWNGERPQKTTCSYLTGTSGIFVNGWMLPEKSLTVFRKEVVSSANNKWHDQTTQFLQLLIIFFLHRITCVGVSTFDNRHLEFLPEFYFRAKVVGIREVEEREVFWKIVLTKGAKQWVWR